MEQTPVPAAPAQPAAEPVDSSSALASLSTAELRAYEQTGAFPDKKAPAAAAPAGDDAPAVDAQGKAITGQDGKPVSKRQQAINDRIRESVDRATATERARADAAERKIAELEARATGAQPPAPKAEKPAAQPAAGDKEPSLEDFLDAPDPYLALTNALVKFRVQEALGARDKESAAATQQRAEQDAVRQFVDSYAEKEQAFIATTPDYADRTLALRQMLDVRMPLDRAAIDAGPEMILHLAEHPDDVQRIGRLAQSNLPAALRELGKLEATLTKTSPSPALESPAPAQPQAKQLSDAPAPGTTLGKRAADTVDEADGALKRGDFRAYADAQNRKELAAARSR